MAKACDRGICEEIVLKETGKIVRCGGMPAQGRTVDYTIFIGTLVPLYVLLPFFLLPKHRQPKSSSKEKTNKA